MPVYEFQDEVTGEWLEVLEPDPPPAIASDEPARIGDKAFLNGRPMVRAIPSGMTLCAVPTFFCPGADSLPRARWDGQKWVPPASEPWHPPRQEYDSKGKPVFTTVKAREEFIARSNGAYAYGVD